MKNVIILVAISIVFMLILYLFYLHLCNGKYIRKKTGIAKLGYVPLNSGSNHLIIQNDFKSNIIEYLKDIRYNILNADSKKIITITSCNPKEGKSWIADNLSVLLARMGKKVLLIDANLKMVSNKSDLFYTNTVEGLSDFIRDINVDDTLSNLYKSKKYIQQTQIPNLYILQNGTITVNSSELLKSNKLSILLNTLKEIFDYIIIDGVSLFENDFFINIVTNSDTNILVVDKHKTNCNDLIKVKDKIELNNGEILGFILNKTKMIYGKYYAKKKTSKLGLYMETTKVVPDENPSSLDDLIAPLAKKIESTNLNRFDLLHQELRDNILIEDFINDIEVNFNLKLDNINQNSKSNTEQISILSEKIENNQNIIKEAISEAFNKNEKTINSFTESSQNIFSLIKNMQEQIKELKLQLNNQNYSEQIKELEQKINSNNELIEEFNNQSEKAKNKKPTHTKKSNIINLEKLFMENSDFKIFSINEPIAYEELEELALDIIEFTEPEKKKQEFY